MSMAAVAVRNMRKKRQGNSVLAKAVITPNVGIEASFEGALSPEIKVTLDASSFFKRAKDNENINKNKDAWEAIKEILDSWQSTPPVEAHHSCLVADLSVIKQHRTNTHTQR